MLPRIIHFVHSDGSEYIVIQTEDCDPIEFAKPGFTFRSDNSVVLPKGVDVGRLPCDRALVSDG